MIIIICSFAPSNPQLGLIFLQTQITSTEFLSTVCLGDNAKNYATRIVIIKKKKLFNNYS